uniref:Uncharacterized protein n=1 Tax=Romanomermis culicivorax TaxID=13658 RepID=A0A915JR78_ROMCU
MMMDKNYVNLERIWDGVLSSSNIIGAHPRNVGGAPGMVWIRTLVASMGANIMSAKNSALALAAKYKLVRHVYFLNNRL